MAACGEETAANENGSAEQRTTLGPTIWRKRGALIRCTTLKPGIVRVDEWMKKEKEKKGKEKRKK